MLYSEFQNILSHPRMNRYLAACNGMSKKAMTLYRKNIKLSQELFTIISCFEIALRNKVDAVYGNVYGADWLKSEATNGMLDYIEERNGQMHENISGCVPGYRNHVTYSRKHPGVFTLSSVLPIPGPALPPV